MKCAVHRLSGGWLVAAVLAAGVPAAAAPIASDGFETYPSGSQFEDGVAPNLNGGTGFTGAYNIDDTLRTNVTVASQPMSYSAGTVSVNGGAQAMRIGGAANSTNLVQRGIPTQTGTVYFSFLYRTNNPLTSEDFLQIGLSDATTGEPRISVGTATNTAGNVPPGTFYARVPNAGTSSSSGIVLNPDTTYLVVGKASKAGVSTTYNRIDLFVNPTSETEPMTPSATVTAAAGTGAASLSSFIIRTARLEAGDAYFLDELMIGQAYGDVVPVPEPTTWVLFAVVGLGWLGRRFLGERGGLPAALPK